MQYQSSKIRTIKKKKKKKTKKKKKNLNLMQKLLWNSKVIEKFFGNDGSKFSIETY